MTHHLVLWVHTTHTHTHIHTHHNSTHYSQIIMDACLVCVPWCPVSTGKNQHYRTSLQMSFLRRYGCSCLAVDKMFVFFPTCLRCIWSGRIGKNVFKNKESEERYVCVSDWGGEGTERDLHWGKERDHLCVTLTHALCDSKIDCSHACFLVSRYSRNSISCRGRARIRF